MSDDHALISEPMPSLPTGRRVAGLRLDVPNVKLISHGKEFLGA
jgi:hypothetical protein